MGKLGSNVKCFSCGVLLLGRGSLELSQFGVFVFTKVNPQFEFLSMVFLRCSCEEEVGRGWVELALSV